MLDITLKAISQLENNESYKIKIIQVMHTVPAHYDEWYSEMYSAYLDYFDDIDEMFERV